MADPMKKPSLAEAMAKPKADPMAAEEDSSEGFDAAAEELFEAVKADDVAGFKTALRAAMACK